ncbi:MAG: hypothetical protein QXD70_01065 [Candidatus Bathyarchaeia archaeon]
MRSVKVNAKPVTVVHIAGSSQIGIGESLIPRVATAYVQEVIYQTAFQTAKDNRFLYSSCRVGFGHLR